MTLKVDSETYFNGGLCHPWFWVDLPSFWSKKCVCAQAVRSMESSCKSRISLMENSAKTKNQTKQMNKYINMRVCESLTVTTIYVHSVEQRISFLTASITCIPRISMQPHNILFIQQTDGEAATATATATGVAVFSMSSKLEDWWTMFFSRNVHTRDRCAHKSLQISCSLTHWSNE